MSETNVDFAQNLSSRIATMSYEEARSHLVDIVSRLEQGAIPLEESLRLWEVGEALARRCQEWLDGATERLRATEEGRAPRTAESSTPSEQASPTAAPAHHAGAPASSSVDAAPSAAAPAAPAPAPANPAETISALRAQVTQVEADPDVEFSAPPAAEVSEDMDTSPLVRHPEDFE